ncbi:MAG: beta-lactamase family protein [Spirochaetales bacterium]|nr:beta-lactamase family protein [Spirochaetales bacterium]
MKKRTPIFPLILFIGVLASSCAGTPGATSSGSFRSPEEMLGEYTSPSGGTFPGIAVSVIRGGETVYREVAGVRSRDSLEPISESDPFHIGSNTKAMTALLCGIMVDRNLLSWQTPLREVLGDGFPMREEYRDVTVEQLLSHTSGIPSVLPQNPWLSFFPYDSPAGTQRERMAREALQLPPAHVAGSEYLYSNLGYVVAGFLLEELTEKSWETLIKEELFTPLEMENAGFGPPAKGDAEGDPPSAPWGHNPAPVNPGFMYADNPLAMGPAGTVHANLQDLENYLSLYFHQGLSPQGEQIISRKSLLELMKPRLESYSLGWLTGVSDQGKPFLVHDGSNTMFYCSFLVFPESKDGIIILTNRGDGKSSLRVTELLLYFAESFLDATITGEE